MRKKSRKGKKRNISKVQRHLELLQQCEGKLNMMNSFMGIRKEDTQEWAHLTQTAQKWRAEKFDTAGKAMLAVSKKSEING